MRQAWHSHSKLGIEPGEVRAFDSLPSDRPFSDDRLSGYLARQNSTPRGDR